MATKKLKKGFIETPDKQSFASKGIASIIRQEDLYILLNKQGRQISYSKLSDVEGKTCVDADACTAQIIDADKKDSMLSVGDRNYVRCSAVEAIENHRGRDYSGLIIRGENDSILAYLEIRSAEVRGKVAEKLHVALEAYIDGKFKQPDLTEYLSTN